MVYSAKSDDSNTISQFTRRKSITVTTGGTSMPANYQVKLTIIYESEMQVSFDDIRFNTKSGIYIDYWIESKIDSNTADVWIELPDTVTDPGSDTIFMYYGNTELNSESNGDDTFEFFDDFDDDEWTRDATNPVIEHSTGVNDEDSYQLYNGRIIDDGNNYRMYYTANQLGVNRDQIFTATSLKSDNFKNWTKHMVGGNVTPVLALGVNGTWDDSNVYGQTIIKESSSSYKMWYIGDDGTGMPHFLRIGYATSNDGINWTKHGSNPIYSNTSVSIYGIAYFIVWKEDATHYYAAMSHYLHNGIDILQSADGLSWSTLSLNVIADIQSGELKKINGVYYIYGCPTDTLTQIKCYSATNISGPWTDRGIQFTATGSGWEHYSDHPALFEIDTGNYLLSYSGYDGSTYIDIGISTLDNNVPYIQMLTDKWVIVSGSPSVLNGKLLLSADLDTIRSKDLYNASNYILEGKYLIAGNYSGYMGFSDTFSPYIYSGDCILLQPWLNPLMYTTDSNNGVYTQISRGDTYSHTWQSFLISLRATEAYFEWESGTQTAAQNTNIPDENMYIAFQRYSAGNFEFDDIRLRKYIVNEPTFLYDTAQHQRRVPQFM